jgi:hypothetical protein
MKIPVTVSIMLEFDSEMLELPHTTYALCLVSADVLYMHSSQYKFESVKGTQEVVSGLRE